MRLLCLVGLAALCLACPHPPPVTTSNGTPDSGSAASSSSSFEPASSSGMGVSSSCRKLDLCPAPRDCGQVPDGCGGFLDCGFCAWPARCDDGVCFHGAGFEAGDTEAVTGPVGLALDGERLFVGVSGDDAVSVDGVLVGHSGRAPVAVAVADLTLDGRVDVVSANVGDATFSIFVATENGWEMGVTIAAGAEVNSLGIADVSGDGVLDLVGAGDDGNVVLLRGMGGANFSVPEVLAAGVIAQGLVFADIDHDGRDDVITADPGANGIRILRGLATGLEAQQFRPAGHAPNDVTSADFNGDGIDDVAVANSDSSDVTILFGAARLPLFTSFTLPIGQFPSRLAVQDFNLDGVVDLVVADGAPLVSFALGRGDGGMDPVHVTMLPAQPADVLAHDHDHDGKPDVVVSLFSADQVRWLINVGDRAPVSSSSSSAPGVSSSSSMEVLSSSATSGAFSSSSSACVPRTACDEDMQCGEIDDGCGMTVRCGECRADQQCDGRHGCIARRGFELAYAIGVGAGARAAAAGTMLAVALFEDDALALVTTDGGVQMVPAVDGPSSVLVTDVNADGAEDLVVTGALAGTVGVVLSGGDGGFSTAVETMVGASPRALALMRDGRFAVAYAANSLAVMHHEGAGAVVVDDALTLAGQAADVLAADVDSDMVDELVIASAVDENVQVLRRGGDGGWLPDPAVTVGGGPGASCAADFDDDGKTDLAVATNGGVGLAVLLQDAMGLLGQPAYIPVATACRAVACTDADGDGNQDVAVACAPDQVWLALGNGDGTFVVTLVGESGTEPRDMVLFDVTGDGAKDLVVVNGGSNDVSVFAGIAR